MSRVANEVSPSLFWAPFEGSVEKEPLFAQYTKYVAQSATSSDVSWYLETPANGVLLDNEVWVEWTCTITDVSSDNGIRSGWGGSTYSSLSELGQSASPGRATAFRCGNILQRACQTIALDINGTVMTYEFSKYHDALNRLFLTKEESESVFPISGGHFDSGRHLGYTDGFWSDNTIPGQLAAGSLTTINIANLNTDYLLNLNYTSWKGQNSDLGATTWLAPYLPISSDIGNEGLDFRLKHLELLWREKRNVWTDSGVTNTQARYPQTVSFIMREKLSIAPFHLYDNRDIKMSIPNIRTLQLTFQLHSNYIAQMFRTVQQLINSGVTVDFYSDKPRLWMRWYTPPPGYVIPKQVSLPVTKYWTYTNASVSAAVSFDLSNVYVPATMPLDSGSLSVSNISLPAIPDLLLFYYKRRLSEYQNTYPDDYNLAVKQLYIDFEGNSGKLNNSIPIHYWNMYRRHLRLYPNSRDSFDNWFRFHCVIPIAPSDLGVIRGPGMDNPIQLSINNIIVSFYYGIPSLNWYGAVNNDTANANPSFNPEANNPSSNAATFDLQLVAVYDKYALTLTSDGSSSLQLLRVNSGGSSTAPPANVGPSSLADISI